MKKILVLFVATCLSAGTAFAQKTDKKDKKIVMTVMSGSLAPFYEGCGNEIETIAFGETAKEKTAYSAEGAAIIPGARAGILIIVPNSGIKEVVLKAVNGKQTDSETLRVRAVPSATVVVVGFENVEQSVKVPTELSLKVVPDESFAAFLPKEASYRIESFTVIHARGIKSLGSYKSDGNKVDLSKIVAEDGDHLVIKDIAAKRSNFRGEVLDTNISTKAIQLNIKP